MTTDTGDSPFRLAVLNPGGTDPFQSFSTYPGNSGDKAHAPVNYHAYAACTAGSFHRSLRTIGPEQQPVLLLLRNNLRACLKCLLRLQADGKVVAVSLKESGSHQVAALLNNAQRLRLFREICTRADFCLSSTPELTALYLGAGARRAEFVPTPYPVDDSRWDFSRSGEPAATMGDRRGIFIGTREFDVPSRNHLAALWAARQLDEPVTVMNLDGRRGRRQLEALGFDPQSRTADLRIIDGRVDYRGYLQLIARHRIVFQLDRSAVPGQVAGDALLCRVPCVGGDGALERVTFPKQCGHGRDAAELVELARTLLRDDSAYAVAIEESQHIAHEQLSFATTAKRLEVLFSSNE
jgi:hypothetical protein